MEKSRAIELLEHLAWDRDIDRNPYGDALNIAIDALKAQLSQEGATSDLIRKFIDGLEEIFADLRERHVDDSVCGLCEYDGAYIGQSGDWCNECPGFDRDDCFKLSDKTRKEWTEEIIKALPTVQPEPQWIPVSERLPEEPGYYITSNEYNGVSEDFYYDGHFWNADKNAYEVIAWMPKPEAYKPNK